MAKHIRVEENAHSTFENYAAGEDHSKVIRRLVKAAEHQEARNEGRIGLVVLEDSWWSLSDNPRQASSGPFLEGLSKYMDHLTVYRFNFYDTSSFDKALVRGLTVPENRVLLYIGAHGSTKRIGGANLSSLLDKLSEKSKNDKKIEGVILSSCMVAGNDNAIPKAFSGRTNWLFGYSESIDWLGSILIETAVLESICRAASDYCSSTASLLDTFRDALQHFNEDWHVAADEKGNPVSLKSAISFWVRPKSAKKPKCVTSNLISITW